MSEQRPTPRTDALIKSHLDSGHGSDHLYRLNRMIPFAHALERELAEALEALTAIRNNCNADDPESYRADDREGCLDAVFSIADTAISKTKGESK